MAHAIIFVDRAPRTKPDDYTAFHLAYPAGPYKIASVLRDMGLDVLVVPHCYNFTFAGLKQIIDNNSKDLLWVGISTTFMLYDTSDQSVVDHYRQQWVSSKEATIDTDFLLIKNNDGKYRHQLLWSLDELGKLGFYLEKKFNAPLLMGGTAKDVSDRHYSPSNPFHKNIYFVQGYAENYVKEFTSQKLKDRSAPPPLFVNNSPYDDNDFKFSTIVWNKTDIIEEDDWLPIETARGCAFNCSYCNYPRRSRFDSFKDPETLRKELIKNYEQFGVTRYNIIDDLYNDSKEKVRIFHEQVWSKLPFRAEWVTNLRLDMMWVDPESIEIIRDDGCVFGQFGVETLHDIAGRKVGKGLGRDRIIKTLERIKPIWGTDTLVSLNMIAGLPFEPLSSIIDSMNWTVTTDLIHSANWQPLYIAMPDIANQVFGAVVPNQIETDNDKYQVRWVGPKEWENSEGVRFTQVADLCYKTMTRMPVKFKINLRNYMDLRKMGFSHQRIANIKNHIITDQEMKDAESHMQQELTHRLQQLLNITT